MFNWDLSARALYKFGVEIKKIAFVFRKMCDGLFCLMVIKHILRIRKGHSEFPCGHKSLVFKVK